MASLSEQRKSELLKAKEAAESRAIDDTVVEDINQQIARIPVDGKDYNIKIPSPWGIDRITRIEKKYADVNNPDQIRRIGEMMAALEFDRLAHLARKRGEELELPQLDSPEWDILVQKELLKIELTELFDWEYALRTLYAALKKNSEQRAAKEAAKGLKICVQSQRSLRKKGKSGKRTKSGRREGSR